MNSSKVERVIMNILNEEVFKQRFVEDFDSIVEEFELSTEDAAFLKTSVDLNAIEQLVDCEASSSLRPVTVYGCFDAY